MKKPILAVVACLTCVQVQAEGILDRIRASDLNDYALGVSISTSPAIYKGVDDSTYLYPYLTSVKEPDLTDDWFVVGEGDIGFRMIRGDWAFGAVGRIQTMGFDESDELPGVNQRKWAIEMAPTLEYRRFPVKVSLKPYFEPTDRHDGTVSLLEFSYPVQGQRGFINPSIEFEAQSSDYTDYYFGVVPGESSAAIGVYEPDAALNTRLKVRWGYRLNEKWILTGRAAWTWFDDEIADSPLIDRDDTWMVNVGLAYNADFFDSSRAGEIKPESRFSMRVSAVDDRIDSEFVRDAAGNVPGTRLDLEDELGLSDSETMLLFDARYRFGYFHRVEFAYSSIDRDGAVSSARLLNVGQNRFDAGDQLLTTFDAQTFRLSYGYSIIRDNQKELGISGGLHQTRVKTEIVSNLGVRESSSPDPLLPTIGAYAMVALGNRLEVSADVHMFRMDFDRYDGSMTFARVDATWNFSNMALGVGYSFYSMDLDVASSELEGSFDFRHQGPTASLSFSF